MSNHRPLIVISAAILASTTDAWSQGIAGPAIHVVRFDKVVVDLERTFDLGQYPNDPAVPERYNINQWTGAKSHFAGTAALDAGYFGDFGGGVRTWTLNGAVEAQLICNGAIKARKSQPVVVGLIGGGNVIITPASYELPEYTTPQPPPPCTWPGCNYVEPPVPVLQPAVTKTPAKQHTKYTMNTADTSKTDVDIKLIFEPTKEGEICHALAFFRLNLLDSPPIQQASAALAKLVNDLTKDGVKKYFEKTVVPSGVGAGAAAGYAVIGGFIGILAGIAASAIVDELLETLQAYMAEDPRPTIPFDYDQTPLPLGGPRPYSLTKTLPTASFEVYAKSSYNRDNTYKATYTDVVTTEVWLDYFVLIPEKQVPGRIYTPGGTSGEQQEGQSETPPPSEKTEEQTDGVPSELEGLIQEGFNCVLHDASGDAVCY